MARVVVIDPDPDPRLLALLAEAGHRVELVSDAIAGSRLVKHPIDLVIVESALPQIGGAEFCTEMRSQGRNVRLVMYSSRDDEDTMVEALAAGADDFVSKSAGTLELRARIRAALRRAALG